MDADDIRLLHDYNRWANARILAAAAELPPERLSEPTAFPWSSLLGTLVHILDSEHVWRILCRHRRYDGRLAERQAFPTLAAVVAAREDEERAMQAYLDDLRDEDMDSVVRYETPEGTRERILWHCLAHVVNHGTQHRSECAAMLKGAGRPPVALDMTRFLNERGSGTG